MTDFKKLYTNLSSQFYSGAHTTQNRLFGFTTTNIRHIGIITKYIIDLVPKYLEFKENYTAWKEWCYHADNQQQHKQKFLRLEHAKILWRDVCENPQLNNIAVKFYEIQQSYGKEYLNVILYLYLLTGRYWNVNNQPIVEIQKLLHNFKGDIERDFAKITNGQEERAKLFLCSVFYNPRFTDALDISYGILNSAHEDNYLFISKKFIENDTKIHTRLTTNGGKGNFIKDALVIYNYYLFKKHYLEQDNLNEYINHFVDNKLYAYFKIQDNLNNIKSNLKSVFNIAKEAKILQELDIQNILEDTDENIIPTTISPPMVRKQGIKEKVFAYHDYKCFFEKYEKDSTIGWHQLGYFQKQDGTRYLEAHHLIPMKNSRFFATSLDVKENLLPLCPNCHRKIHHANNNNIKLLLEKAYSEIPEEEFMRKGIYISQDKLYNFYGVDND